MLQLTSDVASAFLKHDIFALYFLPVDQPWVYNVSVVACVAVSATIDALATIAALEIIRANR